MTPAEAGALGVGLDVGTSGLKGVIVDPARGVVATARAGYPTARPEPGASEQDPADWRAAAEQVLRELAAATDPARWAGIGLSGMIPTLVTLDAAGQPVGPAITWEDARAEPDGDRLRTEADPAALYATTGQRLDGRYLLPMYLRVARLDPTRAARTASLAGAKDYLFGWLTGRLLTDPSTATGFGCFDLAAGAWSQPVLAAAGRLVPTALPALPGLAGSGEQHPLRPELAARLGLPAGLAVAVGGADSVLGALGLGAGQTGDTAYLAGTSTVILGVSGTPTPDPEQRYLITPLAGSAGWGLEMDLLATGSSVRWLAELVGGPGADTDALLDEAADIAPEDAPVLLPYLAPGEQGALWDPTLAGTLYGMTLHHDRRHLLRALQTGIVLESRRCLAVLADVAGTGDVWVGGGGIRPALAAELAAASRRSVRRPVAGGDESAVGAALLVAAGPPPATAVVHPPDPAEARRWDELARRHEAALVAARGYYRADHRHSP